MKTPSQIRAALEKPGRFLMLTLGGDLPEYAINGHGRVALKAARKLVEAELFEAPAIQTKHMPGALIPSNDGLFPGFTQTWRVKQ